jgi:hypothetical protein
MHLTKRTTAIDVLEAYEGVSNSYGHVRQVFVLLTITSNTHVIIMVHTDSKPQTPQPVYTLIFSQSS